MSLVNVLRFSGGGFAASMLTTCSAWRIGGP